MNSRSAATLALGVSIAAAPYGFAACGGRTADPSGESAGERAAGAQSAAGAPSATAGAPGSAGAPAAGGAPSIGGSSGAADGASPPGVLLVPTDGWVEGMSNPLGIQGALFAIADQTTQMTLTSDFTGTNACIKGVAAKVDLLCTPVVPATDCFGTFWGAAIGMNLNQPIDPKTMLGGAPEPFDASGLSGFAFEISGAVVPSQQALEFTVEDDSHVFCNVRRKKLLPGENTVLFSELVERCFRLSTDPPNEPATAHQAGLIRIEFKVVTNTTSVVPFDFCISNIRALKN